VKIFTQTEKKHSEIECFTMLNEQLLSGCSTTPPVISVSNPRLFLNFYAVTVTSFISLVV